MLLSIGENDVYQSLATLCATASVAPTTPDKLNFGIRQFMRGVQPNVPVPEALEVHWAETPLEIAKLLQLFNEESLLDDVAYHLQFTNSNEGNPAMLHKTLHELSIASPRHAELFSTVFHTVFSAPSNFAQGGTTSGALGALWMNPSSSWSDMDYVEFFVHELTHMAMFLDDWCHQHYVDLRLVAEPANWAQSAIRHGNRPLDKALHSLVVATEILLFRRDLGSPLRDRTQIHPSSSAILSQARHSSRSMLDPASPASKVLTRRGKEIAQKCFDKLSSFRHD